MDKITIPKEITDTLYKQATATLKVDSRVEKLIDKKLIYDIYSRGVALYVIDNFIMDDNEFKLVTTRVNNEVIKVSVGTIKTKENEPSTVTYGII